MKRLLQVDFITMTLFTSWGLINGSVTVFYIIYLFLLQEVVRTIIDSVYIYVKKIKHPDGLLHKVQIGGSFFLLFLYAIFIIIFFGLVMTWYDQRLVIVNAQILFLKNVTFNLNLAVFIIEYAYFRIRNKEVYLAVKMFNYRHIILHVSIVLGAMIQMLIVKHYQIETTWGTLLIIAPFFLLKYFIEFRMQILNQKKIMEYYK